MTLLAKLGLSVLGGGTVAAGGYGVYELIKPKTVADQLKWEGFVLGYVGDDSSHEDNGEAGLWNKLFTKYSPSDSSSNTDKFKNGETDDSTITNKETLREKCKNVFSFLLTKENENNLKQARFWCVRNSEKLNNQ